MTTRIRTAVAMATMCTLVANGIVLASRGGPAESGPLGTAPVVAAREVVSASTPLEPDTEPAEAALTPVAAASHDGGLLSPLLGGSHEPPPDDQPAADASAYDEMRSWSAGVQEGQYLLEIAVRADRPGRADVLVDGEMVASHGVGTAARTVDAILHTDGPGSTISVGGPSGLQVQVQSMDRVQPTFTVRGTRILDPSGQEWRPLGVNRGGYQESVDGSPIYNRFGHESGPMTEWGFNFVRLPLNQEFWIEDCPVEHSWVHDSNRKPDGSAYRYREVISEEVARYTNAGMMVLLDLHASARGEATGCDDDGHHLVEMPDARSETFWHMVAMRFRSNPYVAFDLFNEPQFNEVPDPPSQSEQDRIWRNGGSVKYRDGLLASNTTYEAVGMQRLYDTVRDTGARNLVFVAGLGYAHEPTVHLRQPLDATGMVVSVHTYCSSDRCDSNEYPEPVVKRRLYGELPGEPERVGVAERFSVVITEFGTKRWWDSTPNSSYVSYWESQGLGWAVYSWAGGGTWAGQEPYGILADPTHRTADRQPNSSGRPIWDVLAPFRASG